MARTEEFPSWPGWETVRLIGRGSFAAVYEIRREVFGTEERAALKLISIPQDETELTELVNDGYGREGMAALYRDHLESIVSEYSLMRKLNGNSNVVNCDDIRTVPHADGVGWDILIKMELLTPLPNALELAPAETEVLRIGKDLCTALILCRRHSIVHRDIKPGNIFVSDSGVYKLGDFGIAKTMEKTSGGTKIGTYDYMAPEVYHNQPYGHGADLYSLGLVLYWLLNERRLPFLPLPPQAPSAPEREAARSRRLNGETLPPPAHGSRALRRIVLKACAFDPRNRYRTAEELLEDLETLGDPAFKALAPHADPRSPSRRVSAFGAQDTEPRQTALRDDGTPEQEDLFGQDTDPLRTDQGREPRRAGNLAGQLFVSLLAVLLVILIVKFAPSLRVSSHEEASPAEEAGETLSAADPSSVPQVFTPSPSPSAEVEASAAPAYDLPRPENVKVFFFEDEKEEFTLAVGEAVRLKAVAYPTDRFANAGFSWTVSDPSVLELSPSADTRECAILCLKHQPGGVTLTVNCLGVAREIKIYTKN